MSKLRLLYVLLLLCQVSFSQKNFQPGTIVTADGASITGQIDYRNWKANPEKIAFRKDKTSEEVIYGVMDLKSFTVSGDVYRQGVIEITERQDNISQLTTEENLPTRTDTVFLLTVVSGPKSLFSYADNVDHFYIENENKFEFLKFKKYKVEISNTAAAGQGVLTPTSTYISTDKGYINQLRDYLKSCSKIGTDLEYNLNSLRKAFAFYYSCLGTKPEFIQVAQNEKIEIGVLAGPIHTTFDVNTSRNDFIGTVDFTSSTSFAAGVFFDIVFPRQRGRISLNNELMYSSYKTGGGYNTTTGSLQADDYTYAFEYSYVKLNTMLRYKFFLNNAIIFINGGVSNGSAIKEVNTLTRIHTFNGTDKTTVDIGFNDTRKYELGFVFGAGVRKNRISVELRGEKANGPFKSPGYQADVMRYMALVGYRFR